MKYIIALFILLSGIQASNNSIILEDDFNPSIDKISHSTTSFGLYYVFRYFDKSKKKSVLLSFTVGLSYEIYQIYDPLEQEYFRGVSLHDLFYNVTGIMMAVIIDDMFKNEIPKNFRKREDLNIITPSNWSKIGFVKAGFLVQGLSKDEATKQLNANMKYICDGINPGILWEIFSKKHQYMESVKTLLELDENPDADEGSSAGLWDGSNLITYNHHAPKTNLYFYLTGKKLNYLEPKGLDWRST